MSYTLWAVMRACRFDQLDCGVVSFELEQGDPTRFIPVFDSEQEARDWAFADDLVIPLRVAADS